MKKIEEAEIITIYAHHYPDGDCVGCEMGLKKILLANYPGKKVYALGENSGRWQKVFGTTDIASDEDVANSLAIIVDHNSYDRCGDNRIRGISNGLRFDHHIGGRFPYPFPALVDVDAVSASQVILEFALRVGWELPIEAIDDFCIAFFDDRRQYTEFNRPPRTQQMEYLFLSLGADIDKALDIVLSKDDASLDYEAKIAKNCRLFGQISVAIMQKDDYESLGISYPDAGSKGDCLLALNDAQVALLFTYSDNEIRLSARSRGAFSVQALCAHFGGGGHLQAAGATFDDVSFPIESVVAKAQTMLDEWI